jgi:electron transport complex protein RnfG
MKIRYITQAWLVLMLALLFGGSLAGVQTCLNPRIAKNKLNDTMSQIPNLVPGATAGQAEEVGSMRVYQALDKDGQQVGWVIPASGQGFADVIELLVGVNMDLTQITGMYVLEQKETPGLGNKIVTPTKAGEKGWRTQFAGKPANQKLTVVKTAPTADNDIEAVTGATDSVVHIVNQGIADFRKARAQAGQ